MTLVHTTYTQDSQKIAAFFQPGYDYSFAETSESDTIPVDNIVIKDDRFLMVSRYGHVFQGAVTDVMVDGDVTNFRIDGQLIFFSRERIKVKAGYLDIAPGVR